MDCSYSRNPEIYENFIMDRLPEAEKQAFQVHLESCEICRKELNREKVLIQGLREAGKAEMKREIRDQVSASSMETDRLNWGLMLKIAAVVLFLVITPGMIYYYQQFPTTLQKDDTNRNLLQEPAPGTRIIAPSRSPAGEATRDAVDGEPKKVIPEQFSTVGQKDKTQAAGKPAPEVTEKFEVIRPNEGQLAEQPDLNDSDQLQESRQAGTPADQSELESSAKSTFDLITKTKPAEQFRTKTSSLKKPSPASPALDESDAITWTFIDNNKRFNILLLPQEPESGFGNEFPAEFPVYVSLRDSTGTVMQWQANRRILQLSPDSIRLVFRKPSTVEVELAPRQIYLIDISQDSTAARLMR